MLLASPNFNDGTMIPRKFTADGGGINPELHIQNVPVGAKSLALIVHDPDAPIEGGFTHWVVWNIDPMTMLIKDESVPPGSVEGASGRGQPGWVPPSPPPGHGVHHYEFRLYALDLPSLNLAEGASMHELVEAMQGHIIEEAKLVGLYERA